jgi:hypothetical protein
VVDEFEIVSIVLMEKLFQLIHKMFPGFTLSEFFHVHQHTDGLLNLNRQDTGIDWLLSLLFLHGRSIAVRILVIFLFLSSFFSYFLVVLSFKVPVFLALALFFLFIVEIFFFVLQFLVSILHLLLLLEMSLIAFGLLFSSELLGPLVFFDFNLLFLVFISQSCEIVVFGNDLEKIGHLGAGFFSLSFLVLFIRDWL